ncbi:MAG TPA: L-fucose:H+ symporter permease [Candidatus Acidoferrum sp.]|nr:L-fucose:H+ symporter permease [Candidatus Acidoferrum sp.]
MVTSLFLLWGFCNGMIDILNKHFQNTLHINKFQSGFVQFANYISYFLMAIPAGVIARKFGYKGGIIVGLVLIAAGAFWFIPATSIGTYWAFLTGLFIIAAGMTCLETIANPYATLLGAAEHGATRINMAQSFNGIGWILGPIVGGHFVFDDTMNANANAGLYLPYLGVGIVVAVLIVVFALSHVPELQADEEVKVEVEGTGKKPLWQRSHFTFGVAAQFLYVAAQTGIFSFFINYVVENDGSVTEQKASYWLGAIGFVLFLVGRLCGSFVISQSKPQRVLTIYAVLCVVLTALAMGGGKLGLCGLFGTFFFMSIMFPTIFALGIRGLGTHTKQASSLIVMSIVGGAIAPPLMGYIADKSSMRIGFALPLVCFVLIAFYGMIWQKLESRDRAT